MEWQASISVNPAVWSGKPCIKGTRITVQAQRGELIDGDVAFRRFDERIEKVRRKRV